MAWDKTRPADTEKIRLVGQVVRPNWQALEEASNGDADAEKLKQWAVNLVDRSTIAGTNTPAAISDAGQVYARTIGSNVELCYEDTDSNEVQITTNGLLNVVTDKLLNTTGYIEVSGLLIQWGSGIVGASTSVTFTFPKAFSSVYQVLCSYESSSTLKEKSIYVQTKTTTTCRLYNSHGSQNVIGVYLAIGAA